MNLRKNKKINYKNEDEACDDPNDSDYELEEEINIRRNIELINSESDESDSDYEYESDEDDDYFESYQEFLKYYKNKV
jgi:hypothetical protein